jgi:hypothetical protein
MANWTSREKDAYMHVLGMLMKGDPKRKAELDAEAALLIAAMREQMPSADEAVLAEFSSCMHVIGASVLRMTLAEALSYAKRLYESYSVVTAQLIGAYDPKSDSIPNYTVPEILSMLGMDAETSTKVWEAVQRQGHHQGADELQGQYL